MLSGAGAGTTSEEAQGWAAAGAARPGAALRGSGGALGFGEEAWSSGRRGQGLAARLHLPPESARHEEFEWRSA